MRNEFVAHCLAAASQPIEGDQHAGQMEEGRVHLQLPRPAQHQAAEVVQPGEGAFDFPAAAVTAQLKPILGLRRLAIAPVQHDQLNAAAFQSGAQRVAIVAFVGNHPRWFLARLATIAVLRAGRGQGRLQQVHFRRRGRVQVCSQRSTRAIDQNQPFCALAAFGFADLSAPFLAGAKLPSAKHSSQRIFWRSLSWAKNARHKLRNTPASSQACSRRQTVLGLPYSRGNSLHGAPVYKIHKMPSKHCRSETRGRPPFGFGFAAGSCFSTNAHCLSVSFRQAMLPSLPGPHSGF
jgi:hypothetical protein